MRYVGIAFASRGIYSPAGVHDKFTMAFADIDQRDDIHVLAETPIGAGHAELS